MTIPVLICDDSGFARRQMARSIPDGWDVEISFAENGADAISMIKAGKGDVLFLDLNMPVMDGYETMEVIRKQDLPCLVIVVSGDVQPEARTRMKNMGALEFIRKPIDNTKLTTILAAYGIYNGDSEASHRVEEANKLKTHTLEDQLDAYREMVNVAMGQAGESLAQLLGTFIDLPIPNVNLLASNELSMAIAEINHNECVSAVSKGFVGSGIRGEALVIFNDTNTQSMVELLGYDAHDSIGSLDLEALMDVSNILIGACLNGLAEQLNVSFNQTHPVLLGRHQGLDTLLSDNVKKWGQIMAVEIGYAIKAKGIAFDLLLLFPDDAMKQIYSRLMQESREIA